MEASMEFREMLQIVKHIILLYIVKYKITIGLISMQSNNKSC